MQNDRKRRLSFYQFIEKSFEVLKTDMFGNGWTKEEENELSNGDLTMSGLRMLEEEAQKGLLFKAIRSQCNLVHWYC